MPDPSPRFHPPLAYDAPLGPGQVRADHGLNGSLVVNVGPPAPAQQLLADLPVLAMLVMVSVALGLLAFAVATGRAGEALSLERLLLLPTFLIWAVLLVEFALSSRKRSRSVTRLAVGGGVFAFPYPAPTDRLEEVPALRVVRLDVAAERTLLLRRRRHAVVVGLAGGATFKLLAGHPRATLDEVTELLGPALGLRLE
ncbi:MAG TPA: hypothetical protein VF796_02805 [Humisphaera sp.]